MNQIHKRTTFEPARKEELTESELKRAIDSLTFVEEKYDSRIKDRICVVRSSQRRYISKEEPASPTVVTEAIFITGVIEAKEERDIITLDIPNAFIQTAMLTDIERTIIKIRGILVGILVKIAPQVYRDFVTCDRKKNVSMLKPLCSMIKVAILYYKQFVKDIIEIDFTLNLYEPCVTNKMVNNQ